MAESTGNTSSNKANKPDIQDDVDQLKSDLGKISDDIRQITDTLFRTGKGKAREAREQVKGEFNHRVEPIEDFIENKPLITLLIAFAIGLIAGKIFSR